MRQCSPMPVLRSDGSMSSLEVDFSLALLSVLESAKKDPAQFRHMVYELARVQLEREARKENRTEPRPWTSRRCRVSCWHSRPQSGTWRDSLASKKRFIAHQPTYAPCTVLIALLRQR